MRALKKDELKRLKEQTEDILLVNVLPEEDFRKKRIPGSINVPVKRKDFVDRVAEEAGDRDRQIVVYSQSKSCAASRQAISRLEGAGFTNIYHFQGGIAKWLLDGERIASSALNEL